MLTLNCHYTLLFFSKTVAVFCYTCWTRSSSSLGFCKDLCIHSCFGKSGIKLTAHWKGIPVTILKRHSDSSQAQVQGLPLNLQLASILADVGALMPDSRGPEGTKTRPSKVIGTDSMCA